MSVYRLSVIVTLVLAVAFLVPESGNAQSDSSYQLGTRLSVDVPQRYCGRRLSNILQTVCTGVYNNMFKKNVQQEDSKQHERSRSLDSGTRRSNMFSGEITIIVASARTVGRDYRKCVDSRVTSALANLHGENTAVKITVIFNDVRT